MFLNQVLKMSILELKDTVHGMIPSRIMRYALVIFLLIVSVFISSGLVYLVMTNSPLAKNLVQIDKLNGSLIMLITQKQNFFERFDFRRRDMFWGEDIEEHNHWKLMVKQLRPVSMKKYS